MILANFAARILFVQAIIILASMKMQQPNYSEKNNHSYHQHVVYQQGSGGGDYAVAVL